MVGRGIAHCRGRLAAPVTALGAGQPRLATPTICATLPTMLPKHMTRKQFLAASAGLMGAGWLLTNAGCDPEAGDDDGESGGSCNSVAVTIGTNHGHALTVPIEDVMDGQPRSYSIAGGSGHDHMVDVTTDDFMVLAGGGTVNLVSGQGASHTHPVTLRCG